MTKEKLEVQASAWVQENTKGMHLPEGILEGLKTSFMVGYSQATLDIKGSDGWIPFEVSLEPAQEGYKGLSTELWVTTVQGRVQPAIWDFKKNIFTDKGYRIYDVVAYQPATAPKPYKFK